MTPTDGTAVRPIRPDDLEAVGQVAYASGFLGDSATRYFPAQALFCDLWVRLTRAGRAAATWWSRVWPRFWAMRWEPATYVGWGLDGRLRRGGAQEHALRALQVGLARAAPLNSYYRWPVIPPPWPLDRFPTQLHINLLPEACGPDPRRRLLENHPEGLHQRGVPGEQLTATRETGPRFSSTPN